MPYQSVFYNNKFDIIDCQLAILQGEAEYKDFEEEDDDEIEIAAYTAEEWLNCASDEDLFEEF